MTRLALAKTLVTGTVTLQGIPYSFTASASGTATADRVPEAKKIAVAASNTAAVTAARASIQKILDDNSAALTDLEITSLISNNLSTTVVAFKPIALSKIASSSDGVNYTLNPNVTIGEDQWLTVPNGKTLTTGANAFTNKGYFQIGDSASSASTSLKGDTAQVEYYSDVYNSGVIQVNSGGTCTINSPAVFSNVQMDYLPSYGYLLVFDGGILTNNSSISNVGSYSYFYNYGTCNNNSVIGNIGSNSYLSNSKGKFTNNGEIFNGGSSTYVFNSSSGTFANKGDIINVGSKSYVKNSSGNFTNDGYITAGGIIVTWNGTCAGYCP
jgi:hypothetical protein